MSLEFSQIQFIGAAFPEPFIKFDLEKALNNEKLLIKNTGQEGKQLFQVWSNYRRKLRELVFSSGSIRVKNCVIDPLVEILGYNTIEKAEKVSTREGQEDGGYIIQSSDGKNKVRVWTVAVGTDLESPVKRGYAYRFSFIKIALRVLFTCKERLGLITDGQELRIIISDPTRIDSQVIINIDPDWKRSYHVPDPFRFLIALASPRGIEFLPELLDKARLKQSVITKELRVQARKAIEDFIQDILGDPLNQSILENYHDKETLAKILWNEGLVIVYRLLFILKGEATNDPAKRFRFTDSTIWRNTFSPTISLAYYVRKCLDEGMNTGNFLEQGLKTIFNLFQNGVKSTELNMSPLGGVLFGKDSTPLLSQLNWTEKSCAYLLDQLLWTITKRGKRKMPRQRIHYGSLQISDLGNIYELLLELEPGIAQKRMCRLRRAKLDVVVPYSQGEKYRQSCDNDKNRNNNTEDKELEEDNNNRSTKIKWIEEIRQDKFYLRTGLGKKSSGSYYTPESFVRFLVQETLGPKIDKVSPKENPWPINILKIKVLDPAMGSGHFLVSACSFMAERLYEACRLCDEKTLELEKQIERETDISKKEALINEKNFWNNRIIELPDPEDEIVKYLPSSAPEAWRTGFSQARAQVLCKRLVAVHCLYGVDKNPLTVELAKLSLWLETQSEGLPLTFLDHRLVLGDSITGPFFEHLLKYPGKQQPLEDIFTQGVKEKLKEVLRSSLVEIKELEKSIGIDLSDIENKKVSKRNLEELLLPLKILAAAWTGGAMLGEESCDDLAYGGLAKAISEEGKLPDNIESEKLLLMISKGLGIVEENLSLSDILTRIKEGIIIPALPYDLTFPNVFFELTDGGFKKKGFDVVVGNPPWDRLEVKEEEFWSRYDLNILELPDKESRQPIIAANLRNNSFAAYEWNRVINQLEAVLRITNILYNFQKFSVEKRVTTGRPDFYRLFAERKIQVLKRNGSLGILLPSAFHANEGATGIRYLFLENLNLKSCFSFENRKKLFDIDGRIKFDLIVATSGEKTEKFLCAFYLHDEVWLFKENKEHLLEYSLDYIRKVSKDYLIFPECRSKFDAEMFGVLHSNTTESLIGFLKKEGIDFRFGVELHRNKEFNVLLKKPFQGDLRRSGRSDLIPVYEGKTFNQYTDAGNVPIMVGAPLKVVISKNKWKTSFQFYRLAFRAVASSTNERTLIASFLRPGCICNHTVGIEVVPNKRKNSSALSTLAILNSFFMDWQLRQKAGSNIGKLLFSELRFVSINAIIKLFFVHGALRLLSNHDGYELLWREQLGDNWREPNKKSFTWPVLETEKDHWIVRSAIDAVVAKAYGLNKGQYEHVLRSFDRASGANPYTEICLAKFDELKKISLEKFTKKYDPYLDIPINEELPKPFIDIKILEEDKKQKKLF